MSAAIESVPIAAAIRRPYLGAVIRVSYVIVAKALS